MSAETAFLIAQLLPFPIWIAWIAFPRSRVSRHLTRARWPWTLLAVTYVACFAMAIGTGGRIGPQSFTSLGGMMALFDHPWGALAGWVHYLCFDTFVARWIIQRAPEAGYRLAPILFATMMFGPLGLLLFDVARPWLAPAPSGHN